MEFFRYFHNSCTNPSFYREVVRWRGRACVGYLARLGALSVLISVLAHYYYLIRTERGLPAAVSSAFSEIRISSGVLHPERESPFTVPESAVARAMDLLMFVEGSHTVLSDSFVVVDTGNAIGMTGDTKIGMMLRKKEVVLRGAGGRLLRVPYREFGEGDWDFDERGVRKSLVGSTFTLLLFLVVRHGAATAFMLLFTIPFLALATYIFTIRRVVGFREHAKLVCFAAGPVAAGKALAAVAGIRGVWPWYVFTLAATFLVLRAQRALKRAEGNQQPGMPE